MLNSGERFGDSLLETGESLVETRTRREGM
jgi:hypothetical protein